MENPVVLVGVSPAIRDVEDEINRAARGDAKVLITGESGVGKEIVARLIHQRSTRARNPLVTINCAGFPDSLLESELFGHVKGSFTDAHRDKRGWLEMAHGGSIFMDEVGEMSLRMQALLLRFLETGEIQRVGSDHRLPPLNVRIITATHQHLVDRIADQTFREDLYYRLNVIHIEVPPLRERREDIPVLLTHFLRTLSETHQLPPPEVDDEALQCLRAYRWPGNVRELKNLAERLVLYTRDGRVSPAALPSEMRRSHTTQAASGERPDVAAGRGVDALFQRLVSDGDSFWAAVYEPFKARDLTRADVRELVRLGLEYTRGNYKLLVRCFNMQPEDYKPFLNFLRKYDCHVPFQHFRTVPTTLPRSERRAEDSVTRTT